MVSTIDLPKTTEAPKPVTNWLSRISSPQNIPQRENIGFFTSLLALPAPVEEKKLSPEQERMFAVAAEFLNNVPGMLPRGQLEASVSKGYLPTARMRWYPEIMEVDVVQWMTKNGLQDKQHWELNCNNFMHYYEMRDKQERQPALDKWKELVDSKKPETGQWR